MIIVFNDGVDIKTKPSASAFLEEACQELLELGNSGSVWAHLMELGTGRLVATLVKTKGGSFKVEPSNLLAWRLDVPGTVVVRPLPAGTVISSWGAQATVLEDHGNDHLVVDVEGGRQPWSWEYEREVTKVVSLP